MKHLGYKQQIGAGLGAMTGLFSVYAMWKQGVYYVEPGHRAFKFNKLYGVGDTIYREGWHLKVPYFER